MTQLSDEENEDDDIFLSNGDKEVDTQIKMTVQDQDPEPVRSRSRHIIKSPTKHERAAMINKKEIFKKNGAQSPSDSRKNTQSSAGYGQPSNPPGYNSK
jgi:hypothetical protein